jgi:homoserine acetyltransferase
MTSPAIGGMHGVSRPGETNVSEYVEQTAQGGSVGQVEKRLYTFAAPPHPLVVESGLSLGPVTLAYETYGELTPEKTTPSWSCMP